MGLPVLGEARNLGGLTTVFSPMPADDLISKMRNRIEQCRRLAEYVTDQHTKRVLNHMAEEAEADLRKFDADCGQDNERREA